jgi:hypothetical protein
MVIHLVTPNQGLEDRKISLIKKTKEKQLPALSISTPTNQYSSIIEFPITLFFQKFYSHL